jgi:phage-related holin
MERILNTCNNFIAYIHINILDWISQYINLKDTAEMITKTTFYILNLVIIWLSPIKGALLFALMLVVADTVTGIMKAGKAGGVKSIQSNKAFKLIPKLIFYSIAIIVCQGLNNYVDADIPWVKLALIGIGWIELKSIDENFHELFGYSFLDKILEALKNFKKIEKR